MRSHPVDGQAWGLHLRALRSDRPARAKRGARGRTYGAALAQAEQLWTASESVGSIASPLLLFYALAQAGRAICAAGVPSGSWEGIEKHGLEFGFERPAVNAAVQLDQIRVAPKGRGLVQQVGEALGSPVLTRRATLGELIGSLDTALAFTPEQLPHRRSLEAHWQRDHQAHWHEPSPIGLTLYPIPDSWVARKVEIDGGPKVGTYSQIPDPSVDEVVDWIAPFPSLRALGSPSRVFNVQPLLDSGPDFDYLIRVEWPDEMDGEEQRTWTVNTLDVVYESFPYPRGAMLPAIGGNAEAQHPLITWWIILYALSMLARYYPTSWTEMLNVDTSLLAVPFEHLIEVGTSQIPGILGEVLAAL